MGGWSDAVEAAVRRLAAKSADGSFTRADIETDELHRIVSEAGGGGATPMQTVSRELQQLRDRGVIQFVNDQGTYRLTG